MAGNQRRRQPDPDAWLNTLVDDDGNVVDMPDYNPALDPLSDRWASAWVIDYRQVKAQELAAHRDRPTRIDLIDTIHGPAKRIWLAGWMPGDPAAVSGPLKPGWTVEAAAADMERQGWKVRRWQGGARCWRVDYRPVRTGRRLEYARELYRKQGKENLDNQALLLDY